MTRLRAWWRYRRRLASSMAAIADRGYPVSAETWRRLAADARKEPDHA